MSFGRGGLTDGPSGRELGTLRKAADVSDDRFCRLLAELRRWVAAGDEKLRPMRLAALGLRPSENYNEPTDAPRIATIYNGLNGKGVFVPFRKGDPEGNRWLDDEPLYIDWSRGSVNHLSTSDKARWQGHALFFTPGITWTAVANHVALKARFQHACVFDADSMRLTPNEEVMHPLAFLSLFNSDVLSYFKMKFLKHTQKWEIGDLRKLPMVMPTVTQEKRLQTLASRAMEAKRAQFGGEGPSSELAAFARSLDQALTAGAPSYLRPSAQLRLLETAADCLALIELAVNWEAEKLYGVEGAGPFDEF